VSSTKSAVEWLFQSAEATAVPEKPSPIQCEVIELFECHRDPLLRYMLFLGIPVHDAEEVVQEVFLNLFRHLQQGRSRKNLRGWIFRVGHNLALRQRYANKVSRDRYEAEPALVEMSSDPSPGPEEQLFYAQRQRRLLAIVDALPDTDQRCLRLRAEGLRYREIAGVLGISLGSVALSLSRSLARLSRADGR
jgi:RNA polymerase sigma-70 factor, ECF subfamily